jgi:hypothetical protein
MAWQVYIFGVLGGQARVNEYLRKERACMSSITLGSITIDVQDERLYNADYYTIHCEQARQSDHWLQSIQERLEDPERIIIEGKGADTKVYSRQPDAILEMAKAMNEHMGIKVTEEEFTRVRDLLIHKQSES